MTWLSDDPCKAHMERLILIYSPLWMMVVAVVVFFHLYDSLSAEGYMLLGVSCAVPCWILPIIFPAKEERSIPVHERYSEREGEDIGFNCVYIHHL